MRKRETYNLLRIVLIFALWTSSTAKVGATTPQEPLITYHSLQSGSNRIEYVKITSEHEERKPTIIFFPGSVPQPVVIKDGQSSFVLPLGNFDYAMLLADFNIVVLQYPHLPAAATFDDLNDSYVYKSIDTAYHSDNYLERYVEVGNSVVEELKDEPWAGSVILFGHSQGAHVVAHIAMTNKEVDAVGYFSGNPMGRFAEMIIKERVNSLSGRVSPEAAQQNIDEHYDSWKSTCTANGENAESSRTWMSFSRCYIDKMALIASPLFIAYGTEDPGAQTCDLLPIYLELGGKRNYAFHPFVGRGHNFEAVNDGKSNFDDMLWQDAIDAFVDWIKQLSF